MRDDRSYVYVIFRPNGIPCYVGKGRGNRWMEHRKRAPHNPHLAAILKAANWNPPVVKVREGLSDAEAVETEKAFIAAIGREVNGGPLVNLTDGGDGLAGYRPSEETRRKIGAAHRGKAVSLETREKMRHAHLGHRRSKEATEKIIKARTGQKASAEHLARTAAGRAAMTPEAKAAMCKAIGEKARARHAARIANAG